jgi:hypothetical protein
VTLPLPVIRPATRWPRVVRCPATYVQKGTFAVHGSQPEHVFDEAYIAMGSKRLAQHGYVVIDGGTLTLLGTQEQTIASAPLADVSAKKVWTSLGQAVSVTMKTETYRVSPGWGRSGFAAFSMMAMQKDANRLLGLIKAGGGWT